MDAHTGNLATVLIFSWVRCWISGVHFIILLCNSPIYCVYSFKIKHNKRKKNEAIKKILEEIRRDMFCCREGKEKNNSGAADPRSDTMWRKHQEKPLGTK